MKTHPAGKADGSELRKESPNVPVGEIDASEVSTESGLQ